jgi:hypothetical protein
MSENEMIGKWIRHKGSETNAPMKIVGLLKDGEESGGLVAFGGGDWYIVENRQLPRVSPHECRCRPLMPDPFKPHGPNPFLVSVKSVREDWLVCDAEDEP